jgi:uncharacterized membrane protein HdeD (DUF308 family)
MTEPPAGNDHHDRSNAWAWWGLLVAAAGVLTALSATTGRDAVIVLITAAIGGVVTYRAAVVGALKSRRRGEPRRWKSVIAEAVGVYVAMVILSGWQFSVWPGFLVTGAQTLNGGNIGAAVFALWRHSRPHRSGPGSRPLTPRTSSAI